MTRQSLRNYLLIYFYISLSQIEHGPSVLCSIIFLPFLYFRELSSPCFFLWDWSKFLFPWSYLVTEWSGIYLFIHYSTKSWLSIFDFRSSENSYKFLRTFYILHLLSFSVQFYPFRSNFCVLICLYLDWKSFNLCFNHETDSTTASHRLLLRRVLFLLRPSSATLRP